MLNIYYVKYTYTYILPAQILHFIIIKLVVHIFFALPIFHIFPSLQCTTHCTCPMPYNTLYIISH